MRTIGVVEAVTFPGIDEILVRRRAPRGGMAVLERIQRTALTEHAMRAGERSGIDAHWLTAAGALMWDSGFVRMCFTGGHRVDGDFIRAWRVNQRGRWIAETDLPTDLGNIALTARTIRPLIRVMSDQWEEAGQAWNVCEAGTDGDEGPGAPLCPARIPLSIANSRIQGVKEPGYRHQAGYPVAGEICATPLP